MTFRPLWRRLLGLNSIAPRGSRGPAGLENRPRQSFSRFGRARARKVAKTVACGYRGLSMPDGRRRPPSSTPSSLPRFIATPRKP